IITQVSFSKDSRAGSTWRMGQVKNYCLCLRPPPQDDPTTTDISLQGPRKILAQVKQDRAL
uniref:Uncharacterized protein n=1 Tax=Macaca fascicularis TaxID=9541 RepID=A0A7N9D0I4_MACFA